MDNQVDVIDFAMLGGAKLKMEEEKKKKKAWTTPTLTPIVRRKPEEGILIWCKYDEGSGPVSDNSSCRVFACVVCNTESPS